MLRIQNKKYVTLLLIFKVLLNNSHKIQANALLIDYLTVIRLL